MQAAGEKGGSCEKDEAQRDLDGEKRTAERAAGRCPAPLIAQCAEDIGP